MLELITKKKYLKMNIIKVKEICYQCSGLMLNNVPTTKTT